MNILRLQKNKKRVFPKVIEALKKGGLVVFPSDTVYGLLADAQNESGVRKLIAFKERPSLRPISVFVKDVEMLKNLVYVNKKQERLIDQLLPGPYTIVLRSKSKVSPLLESEKHTLGVRIPKFHYVNELLKLYGRPVTATSANLFNRSPHHSIESFLKQVPKRRMMLIDTIVDAGELYRHKPSTVINLEGDEIRVIRQGDASISGKKEYTSDSPGRTREIAGKILDKYIDLAKDKALIFILKGELGVGKTVFVKGIGRALGISNIISPTFVVYYEYNSAFPNIKLFVHVDLYNIRERDEFKYLGLDRYIKKGNIMCIEWGEKAGEIIDNLRKNGRIIYIEMEHVDNKRRKITLI